MKSCKYALKIFDKSGRSLDNEGKKCSYQCPFICPEDENLCNTPVLVSQKELAKIGGPRVYVDVSRSHVDVGKEFICQKLGVSEKELKQAYQRLIEDEVEED